MSGWRDQQALTIEDEGVAGLGPILILDTTSQYELQIDVRPR